MEVNNILKLACVFIGDDELANANILNSGSETDTQLQIDKIDKLLQCLALVCEDISRDYLPLVCEEEVVFDDNKLLYTSLSNVVCDIIKIQATNGIGLKFRCFPTYIKANVKKAIVTYSYLPLSPQLNESISNFENKLTERIMAYGVAMEYLFLNSLSDEAAIWETRFLNSIESALRKKSNIVMPNRRWI